MAKQDLFVAEYLLDFNVTCAAITDSSFHCAA